jgi:hypothetical protein
MNLVQHEIKVLGLQWWAQLHVPSKSNSAMTAAKYKED